MPPAARGKPSLSRFRLTAALVSATVLLIAGTGGATARSVTPAGVSASQWGWVVARQPSTAHYIPAVKDRGNSTGGINNITRYSTGNYGIFMPGLGDSGGIAHVTPLGHAPHLCVVTEWGGSPIEGISVQCLERSGDPVDSKFVVNFLRVLGGDGGTSGRLGYLWANDASATDYIPDPNYSYNSSGSVNTIHRGGTGSYWVTMPNLSTVSHGDVQVSTYGQTAACRVDEWEPVSGDLQAHVLCRSISGFVVDSRFTITFMKGLALKGYLGTRTYYLWANQPTTASYQPDPNFVFSSVGAAPPTIHRSATGKYVATLPGMPSGGSVQVTSYGAGKGRCIADSILVTGPTQKVGVHCYDVAGDLKDTRFTLAYAR
jgi:hypothetical protein